MARRRRRRDRRRPGLGGTWRGGHHDLLQAYGPKGPGRLMSFLCLWAIVTTMPLIIASGAVGFSQYATYLYPSMTAWEMKLLPVGVCLLATFIVHRRIDGVG